VLKTFDGMTLRNSIVIAAAMLKAKELGATTVLTGDAADELLGGYSFMWGEKDPEKWKEKVSERVGRYGAGEILMVCLSLRMLINVVFSLVVYWII
jgi:asparagine synthetase B (glutamine-hydrolysing)